MPRHATTGSFKKGCIPWNKGIPRRIWNPAAESEEARERIRLVGKANRGRKRPDLARRNISLRGSSRPGWKFHDGQTYYRRLAKENLPQHCDTCITQDRLVVHHINRDHFDNSLQNLQMLCQSCHMRLHQSKIGVMQNC